MKTEYLTVSQLTRYIHRKFTHDPYLQEVYLRGEISNYNSRRNYQNQYFKLKDEASSIQAIMFKNVSQRVEFDLEEGMSVLVRGRVDVYEPYGTYQIYIEDIQPDGIGALFYAYQQTKERLKKEGLFNAEHKKRIPTFPKKIGVITSASGAVIKDIQTTVARRYPIAELLLFPALVQGKRAADDLVKKLKQVAARSDIDTLIIARGGGSFEDLYPFSEEKVVRQIFAMYVPIIAAIGHETDTVLGELVADLRAPTPTAAAEMATPVLNEVFEQLDRLRRQLERSLFQQIDQLKNSLVKLQSSYIFQQPKRLYDTYLQRYDLATGRLEERMHYVMQNKSQEAFNINERFLRLLKQYPIHEQHQSINQLQRAIERAAKDILKEKNNQWDHYTKSLQLLSPYQVLDRGYTLVTQNDQLIPKSEKLNAQFPFKVHFSASDIITARQDKSEKAQWKKENDDD